MQKEEMDLYNPGVSTLEFKPWIVPINDVMVEFFLFNMLVGASHGTPVLQMQLRAET